jgi:hypothetical protein
MATRKGDAKQEVEQRERVSDTRVKGCLKISRHSWGFSIQVIEGESRHGKFLSSSVQVEFSKRGSNSPNTFRALNRLGRVSHQLFDAYKDSQLVLSLGRGHNIRIMVWPRKQIELHKKRQDPDVMRCLNGLWEAVVQDTQHERYLQSLRSE